MKVFITLTWLLLATSFAYAQDALVNKENYLIGVFVKDGRYRYEIINIRYQDYGADAQKLPAETHFVDGYYKNGKTKPTSEMYRQAPDESVRKIVASLEVAMKGTDAASVREDF